MFENLVEQPADEVLALIKLFKDDQRATKLDLGVGVYRDEAGRTPVMRAIKAAELELYQQQPSKTYLGPEGDRRFVELLQPIVFGEADYLSRVLGMQTPGGSGALRIGLEIAVRAGSRHIWISNPTWPNHRSIASAVGGTIKEYPYFDLDRQTIRTEEMLDALSKASPGDVVLLHGSAHNPTGADLPLAGWDALIDVIKRQRLVPLVDVAYQGLGGDLDEDAAAMRRLLSAVDEALVAYSCDKNFALYRERTGALFVVSKGTGSLNAIASNMAAAARANWSMPPDHGAAAVRIVLESDQLTKDWLAELGEMRSRISTVREAVAREHEKLAPIGKQKGLFSNLALGRETVEILRREHGVYMASSGRINVAGLRLSDAPVFAEALRSSGYFNPR